MIIYTFIDFGIVSAKMFQETVEKLLHLLPGDTSRFKSAFNKKLQINKFEQTIYY